MSLYNPDAGAVPYGIDYTKILSQRDLSAQIPINFVTVPGVSLTPACFFNRRYEDSTAARCFSNILASGFRRLVVDIYWDASRAVWSLCPVELGAPGNIVSSGADSQLTPASLSTPTLSNGQITGRDVLPTIFELNNAGLMLARQESSSLPALLTASSHASVTGTSLPAVSTTSTINGNASSTPLGTASVSAAVSASSDGGTLLQVGPYSCTRSVNLNLFMDVLRGHLDNTEDSLNATTKYLVLHLHAAAPASDPTGSASQPASSRLPENNDSLGQIVSTNNSLYLYTPNNLADQRANLKATGSWFSVTRNYQPETAYFDVHEAGNVLSTDNGWPSESIVVFQKAKRLLAGFGHVDPQMADYNFTADSDTIFSAGYISSNRAVTLTANGHVNSGCYFQPDLHSVDYVNSSWAVAGSAAAPPSDSSQYNLALAAGANLTACGITPVLNETLNNATAGEDFKPYQAFALAEVWSWAPDEPRNTTNNADANNEYRCAALNITTGRWQTGDCTQPHYAACRIANQPYSWSISDGRDSYMDVDAACRTGDTFAVPRTALENAYLLHAWQTYRSSSGTSDELLWVNFNDLDTATCWVVGQNTTCPYQQQTTSEHERTVIVPTVAAVIVFVLAALTIFVKCAANRQNSKRRRRRNDDGWDYEGVPS